MNGFIRFHMEKMPEVVRRENGRGRWGLLFRGNLFWKVWGSGIKGLRV